MRDGNFVENKKKYDRPSIIMVRQCDIFNSRIYVIGHIHYFFEKNVMITYNH